VRFKKKLIYNLVRLVRFWKKTLQFDWSNREITGQK